MVRQANGIIGRRGRWRGGMPGRGRGGRGGMFMDRGGIHKPPPLMARPLAPPNIMNIMRQRPSPHGPRYLPPRPGMPMMEEFGRMGPPRMPPPRPGGPRGGPNLRMGPRVRGTRPPLRGMLPTPRLRDNRPSGLLPPPVHMPGPPGMFRPRHPGPPGMMGPLNRPPMRGRGMPGRLMRGSPRGRGMNINRGNLNSRRGAKTGRGRGAKVKSASSPSGEMNKPWVTEAMKNEILKKHKLHQKAKKARTKEDWEIFKEHRNKVTTMLREAKLEYIGAHPEEDVEKILAEATNQVSDKDESKEATADSEGIDTPSKLMEGAEPMEEGGGANEAENPPDPDTEVEMNQEPVTISEPEQEPTSAQ